MGNKKNINSEVVNQFYELNKNNLMINYMTPYFGKSI